MATKTSYPRTINQATGGRFVEWKNLANIKNTTEYSWAETYLITGKATNTNRPATLSLTNFQFSLPAGSEPTKITVTYRHRKNSLDGKVLNIPAPKFSIIGVNGVSLKSVKGKAMTTAMVTSNVSWNVTGKLNTAQVNSNGFGIKIDYPANTNNNRGTCSISYVRVTIEYKTSSYSVNVKKVAGGYNKDDYSVQLGISNKNKTNRDANLTLTTPAGFTYKESHGTGTIKQINPRTLIWDSKLSSKVGTSNITVVFSTDVTFPVGSEVFEGLFTLVEELTNATGTHTAVITPKPADEGSETEEDTTDVDVDTGDQYTVQTVTYMEPFSFTVKLSDDEYNVVVERSDYLSFYGVFDVLIDDEWHRMDHLQLPVSDLDENHSLTLTIRGNAIGYWFLDYSYVDRDTSERHLLASFHFDIRPTENSLSIPGIAIFEVTGEELDRLGTGYTYILQSYLKLDTTDEYVRDWYRNNRLLVFNNAIEANITVDEIVDPETEEITEVISDSTDYDNLTPAEIFFNAAYISPALTSLNEYVNMECEFTYNEDYPLYLIFSGDYPESARYGHDMGILSFTEACIIENTFYDGRETNGLFPVPLLGLLEYEENFDTSTITLKAYESSNGFRLYDLPLTDNYGTDNDIAIRGIQVTANIEAADNLVVYAKMINPDGVTGERSIVLDSLLAQVDSTNTINIGGLGDLWGFRTNELVDLEDWQLELSVTNVLSNEESTINFDEVEVTFYVEDLEHQQIICEIDNENLANYGVWIDKVMIPEGVNTDTSYLTIEGTDTNDVYRQNIREKEITIEFSIDDCDYQSNTDMLRQVTRLFVNKRDKYNRPIPKRITFSHYPDVYWEYILENAFDVVEDVGYYSVTAKLTIPAGTSYGRESILTSTVGYVQGVAAVRPVIQFKPTGDDVQIIETNTGQSFNMSLNGVDYTDRIIEVDMDNREVYLMESTDTTQKTSISYCVDHNSDWIRLYDEYHLESTNSVIYTVEYNERW